MEVMLLLLPIDMYWYMKEYIYICIREFLLKQIEYTHNLFLFDNLFYQNLLQV